MTDIDRAEAEHVLTELLERAFRSVDKVRLDRIDEVIGAFEVAVGVLEANLIDPSSPSAHQQSAKPASRSSTTGSLSGEGADPVDPRELQKRLMGHSSATYDYSSPAVTKRTLSSGGARSRFGEIRRSASAITLTTDAPPTSEAPLNPILNKLKPTADYSSPHIKGRNLRAGGGATTGLRLRPKERDKPPTSGLHVQEDASVVGTDSPRADDRKGDDSSEEELASNPILARLAEAGVAASPANKARSLRLMQLTAGNTRGAAAASPKPVFLKRLDSPDTHSGVLLAKRKRLAALLERAQAKAELVDLNAFPRVKQKFLAALHVLESSLVSEE